MQNIRLLSDPDLLTSTKTAVESERKATTVVLHCLREVERRRVFVEQGHSSLHDYCMRGLGYSGGAAFRRISAMRLLKDLPELEQKIERGELSLSAASSAQTVFHSRQKSSKALNRSEKLGVLEQLTGKSRREAEAVLIKLAPECFRKEVRRDLNGVDIRVSVTIPRELEARLEKLKNLKSHALKDSSLTGLLTWMVEDCLKRHDPEVVGRERKRRSRSETTEQDIRKESGQVLGLSEGEQNSASLGSRPEEATSAGAEIARVGGAGPMSRFIPAAVRRAVWMRDKGRCQFPGCEARRFLDLDHVRPWSLGGKSVESNLRLLCRAHNAREARRMLGVAVTKTIDGTWKSGTA